MSQHAAQPPPHKKPRWYATRWFIGVAALILGLTVGSGGSDDAAEASADGEPSSTVTVTATPEPAEPTATVTVTETPPTKAGTESTAAAAGSEHDVDDTAPRRKRGRAYQVLEVVDGDTVKVAYQGGVSVRVIGIDTPETVHPSQPDECWGQAASAAATRMLTGKKVRLVFDSSQGRTDAYGRVLAYIEAPGVGDFGLAMLKRGHTAEYTYDTAYRRQAQYRRAGSEAKSAGKAMWGRCGGPDVPLRTAAPTPQPETEQPPAGGGCAPGYDPCVPPYPPDLDCADVDGPVRVAGEDPHGLDADGDGVACES